MTTKRIITYRNGVPRFSVRKPVSRDDQLGRLIVLLEYMAACNDAAMQHDQFPVFASHEVQQIDDAIQTLKIISDDNHPLLKADAMRTCNGYWQRAIAYRPAGQPTVSNK